MVGARAVGRGGGGADEATSGVREQGLGSIPFPQPHPPNCPLPEPQHLVHAGAVPTRQVPSNSQGLEGRSGVQVGGVGLVVAVLGVGGPQVKKGPLQPISVARDGGHPMVAAGGHHQQHVPPLQLNSVPSHLRPPARAVPASTLTWYSSERQRKLLRWYPEMSLS